MVHGQTELYSLVSDYYTTASILNQFRRNCTPLKITMVLYLNDLQYAAEHIWHSYTMKDTYFLRTELGNQYWYGQTIVILWMHVFHIPDLWIIPVKLKPKDIHQKKIIYNSHSVAWTKQYGRRLMARRFNLGIYFSISLQLFDMTTLHKTSCFFQKCI